MKKAKAKSILVVGQSADPDSPDFFDQVQRYIDINWKDVPYYREDVAARVGENYHQDHLNDEMFD